MNKIFTNITLAISLILPAMYSAADTVVFDTITHFKAANYSTTNTSFRPFIIGVEKDSGNTITRVLGGSSELALCIPLILTAMEKPGRYYLNVTEVDQFSQFYCMLELKTPPE